LDDWQIFKNNLKKDTLVVNQAKFRENWPSGFRREDSWQTTDDIRQTPSDDRKGHV